MGVKLLSFTAVKQNQLVKVLSSNSPEQNSNCLMCKEAPMESALPKLAVSLQNVPAV
jgi:hypothetical protein